MEVRPANRTPRPSCRAYPAKGKAVPV